jgi:MFS family permease
VHGARPSSALTRAVLGVTVLNFLFFSAYLFFFPTLPFFIERLGGAESEIGLLIGTSSLAALASRPFIGWLVDTAGRKPVLVGGLALFTLNCLLYNLVRDPLAIFPLRLLTGASLATFITAASTYVSDVAPSDRRGEALSYYGMANSLAFAVGPALGGWIIHADAFAGFDAALTSRAGWLAGARTGELHFTSLFLVAAAIALAALLLAATFAESKPPGAAVRRLRLGDLFARVAAFPAAVNFTSSFVFASMVTFMPLFARDHGVGNPGQLFVVYAAAVIGVRLAVGRFLDRVPRAAAILPSILVLAASMPLLASAHAPGQLYAAAGLYGLGAGVFQPAMMAFLVDRTPLGERGRAMSTFTLGNDLGLSIGAFVLGGVVEAAGARVAFAVAGAVALGGAALFAAGVRAGRSHTAAREAAETAA